MLVNLLIDGNYLLNKCVFTLHKNNLLFGELARALEKSLQSYKRWYPFTKIYLVSDSKEKSWRKKLNVEYKATRKKNNDIDWAFVHQTYKTFKENLQGVHVLEYPSIEGDDWICYIINKSNEKNISNVIISNDHDIKQLIRYGLDPPYINVMSNEIINKQKIFLPKNFQVFLNRVNQKQEEQTIFDQDYSEDFIKLLKNFTDKYQTSVADPVESLITKILSGDNSDNIKSVWQVEKFGKIRGIGPKGAKDIYKRYEQSFGQISITDPDLFENLADIICEKKRLSKSTIPEISHNIRENWKLIHLDLDTLPRQIVEKMNQVHDYR